MRNRCFETWHFCLDLNNFSSRGIGRSVLIAFGLKLLTINKGRQACKLKKYWVWVRFVELPGSVIAGIPNESIISRDFDIGTLTSAPFETAFSVVSNALQHSYTLVDRDIFAGYENVRRRGLLLS